MLKRLSEDPRKKGVELTPHGNGFRTNNGWYVEGFSGNDGEEYERAQKGAGTQRVTKWFILRTSKC